MYKIIAISQSPVRVLTLPQGDEGLERLLAKCLLPVLGRINSLNVLEIGIGTNPSFREIGFLVNQLRLSRIQYLGIDIQPESVRSSLRGFSNFNIPNFQFLVLDARNLGTTSYALEGFNLILWRHPSIGHDPGDTVVFGDILVAAFSCLRGVLFITFYHEDEFQTGLLNIPFYLGDKGKVLFASKNDFSIPFLACQEERLLLNELAWRKQYLEYLAKADQLAKFTETMRKAATMGRDAYYVVVGRSLA